MNRLLSAALPVLLLGACATSSTSNAPSTPAGAQADAMSLDAAVR